MNHAAAETRGASMRTSKNQLTIGVSGTAFRSGTYKGSQINTALDIWFGRVAGEDIEVDPVTTRPFVFFDLGATLADLLRIVTSMAKSLEVANVPGPLAPALLCARETPASPASAVR